LIEGAGDSLKCGDRPGRDPLPVRRLGVDLFVDELVALRLQLGEQPLPPHGPTMTSRIMSGNLASNTDIVT
jgi:hypothetical protein